MAPMPCVRSHLHLVTKNCLDELGERLGPSLELLRLLLPNSILIVFDTQTQLGHMIDAANEMRRFVNAAIRRE